MTTLTDVMSVRSFVAERTEAAHHDLHVHPKISRLLAASLSETEYQDILCGYRSIFEAAEARRHNLGLWPQFSLTAHCSALASDIGLQCDINDNLFHSIECAPGALGMLYAIHGAQFGGMTLRKNLQRVLPLRSHQYFSMGTQSRVWRELVKAMDRYRNCNDAREKVVMGANTVFHNLATECSYNTSVVACRAQATRA